jgi:uncharacterized membrane protein
MIPKNCTNCGSELDANGKFCKECGTSIESMTGALTLPVELFCPNCGHRTGASDKFCRHCALDLVKSREEEQAQPQPPPTAPAAVKTPASPLIAPPSQTSNVPKPDEPIPSPSAEPNIQLQQTKESHSPQPQFLTDSLPIQTEDAPDNPKSLISPAGAAFAVICFFLPWLQISQCGITKTASGAELASFDGSFWLFPLMGVVSLAAYFVAKNQKRLWKARPVIFISSGFALFLLFYKYQSIPSAPEFMGQRIDLGITFGFGSYGTVIGFTAAIVGGFFISRQAVSGATASPASDFQNQAVSALHDIQSASSSLKPNIAAMLCYLLPLGLQFVVMLLGFGGAIQFVGTLVAAFAAQIAALNIESYKNNPLIRFHAYQSIFLTASYYLVTILAGGLAIIVFNQSSYDLIEGLRSIQFLVFLFFCLLLAYLGTSVFASYKAYQKEIHKLPYIGDWAVKRAAAQSGNDLPPPPASSITPPTESISITQTPPILPNVSPAAVETEPSPEKESDNTAPPPEIVSENREAIRTEMSAAENYIVDYGMSKETKMAIGIGGAGLTALLVIGLITASSDSGRVKNEGTIPAAANSANLAYASNDYSYNSSNEYISTNTMSNSPMNASPANVNSSSTNTSSSSTFSSAARKGYLVTDSNVRDAPNKDAYSLGIHFKDAKVEILDETSYETDGKVSTWYKIRVTEYGCSKDTNLGCGKNTSNDVDEGWVNSKNILVTSGSSSQSTSQNDAPPQEEQTIRSNYSVKVYNVDDLATVYVNGSKQFDVEYTKTERRDITSSLRPGNNQVRLVLQNHVAGYTYGFEIFRDNVSIFKDECGLVMSYICKGSSQTGTVYDRVIPINTNAR